MLHLGPSETDAAELGPRCARDRRIAPYGLAPRWSRRSRARESI